MIKKKYRFRFSLKNPCGVLMMSRSSIVPCWFHESLTLLSLHQTQIQRSTIPLEGAGPLSQGRVPAATRPRRGGPHPRRHPCRPARSLRRRNTSTYPCCWRKRASAPPTTPSTKVTDQILQLLAPRRRVRQKCVPEPRRSLCLCLRFR